MVLGMSALSAGCERGWTDSSTWYGSWWTGDTGFAQTEPYEGPIAIAEAGVSCSEAGDQIRYVVETLGTVDHGIVYAEQTGLASSPRLADEHDLWTFATGREGGWEKLDQAVDDAGQLADPVVDWQRNASSVFPCPTVHDASVMTFAFGVWDDDGVFADCLVFGHDPAAMIAGGDRTLEPSFSLSACTIGAITP